MATMNPLPVMASGETPRSDGLNWCNGQNNQNCNFTLQLDVLYDAADDPSDFGDYTHPTGAGVKKVAGQLLNFIGKGTGPGSPWVTPWIVK